MTCVLLPRARGKPDELALGIVLDCRGAIDDEAAPIDRPVVTEVLVLLRHPSLPFRTRNLAITLQPASQTCWPRAMHPYRERQRIGNGASGTRDAFYDDDLCGRHHVPLREPSLIPVIASVPGRNALGERLDDLALQSRPPFVSRLPRCEVVGTDDRRVTQCNGEACSEDTFPRSTPSVNSDQAGSRHRSRQDLSGETSVALDSWPVAHRPDGAGCR